MQASKKGVRQKLLRAILWMEMQKRFMTRSVDLHTDES
jgi:hypothetical protein